MKLALKILIIVAVIALGFGGYHAFIKSDASPYETFEVTKGNVTQEVTLTGKTQSTESVDLSFEASGKISDIQKEIGDKVSVGDPIMSLSSSEISLDLAEAQAGLEVELSLLRELEEGARPEEISVYETKLSNARTDVGSAASALADKLRDAFTKSDDVIRNNIDQLFSGPRSTSPTIIVTVSDGQLKSDIEFGRFVVEETLTELQSISNTVVSSDANALLSKSEEVRQYVSSIKEFLDDVALAVNALKVSSTITQTTVDAYKASVSSARTTINTSVTSILTAEERVRTAISTVLLAEKELALKKSGATSEQISSQTAKIKQAQARIARLRILLGKTVMRSPISGVVTRQDGEVGGVVAPQTVLVTVISDNSLQIEANIPEVDIGRVAVSNPVDITVDAFPGEVFKGVVSYIDPGETIIDGVVNFKSKITIENNDPRLRSGLTVNLEIKTALKENVLVVPQLAILENDEGSFVRKLQGDDFTEVKVTLGIRDRNGNVEILSGLIEGDKVMNVGLR